MIPFLRMKVKRLIYLGLAISASLIFLRFVVRTSVGYANEKSILSVIQLSSKETVRPEEDTVIQGPSKSKGCENSGTSHHSLFMIITSPENLDQRQAIRRILKEHVSSWEQLIIDSSGGKRYQIGSTIRALFFVGRTTEGSKTSVMDLIQEAKEHGDMILDNFFETYLRLTIKTLRMLKWVEVHCPRVPYLIKIDDDVYFNAAKMFGFLHDISSSTIDQESGETIEIPAQDLIAGYKYNRIEKDSNPFSKWYSPPSVWGSEPFPDFVSGICYILGSRVRSQLYHGGLERKLFHLEDVFLTGMVREEVVTKTNNKLAQEGHDGGFSLDVVSIPGVQLHHLHWSLGWKLSTGCSAFQNITLLHSLSPKEILCYHQMEGRCNEDPTFKSWC